MIAVSKNAYFDVLDDIFDKYNSTICRSIKMTPIDLTYKSYAEYTEGSNVTNPKFKVGDHVRISTKTFFLKDTCKIGRRSFCC